MRWPSSSPLFELDPRVDRFVEQVREQVGRHRGESHVDRERLDHREVRALDGEERRGGEVFCLSGALFPSEYQLEKSGIHTDSR